jgi:perosamine synthetase
MCNILLDAVLDVCDKSVICVIVPYMFGLPCNIKPILDLGIKVIEDCSMSFGAVKDKKRVGSDGFFSIFSFYATKMICGVSGGMIITDDTDAYKKILSFTSCGINSKSLSFNYRYNDVFAAITIEQIKKIDSFISHRIMIAKFYSEYLDKRFMDIPVIDGSVCYRYVVKLKGDRNKIKAKMLDEGIECGFGVSRPLHKIFPEYATSKCDISEKISMRSLSLPIHMGITKEDAVVISEKLNKVSKL